MDLSDSGDSAYRDYELLADDTGVYNVAENRLEREYEVGIADNLQLQANAWRQNIYYICRKHILLFDYPSAYNACYRNAFGTDAEQ